MLDEYGTQRFARKIDRLAYVPGTGPNKGYNVIHRCSSCDPSQILIRLDKLLALGGFGSTIMYDYDIMSKIYQNCEEISELMHYATDFGNTLYGDFRMQCYHNGLVTNETIKSAIKDLEENFLDSTEDSYIRIYTNNCHFNLELTNEEVLKILKDRLNNNEIPE